MSVHVKLSLDHFPYITVLLKHDDVIKWKHFRRYPAICMRNSPVRGDFPHKRQWRGALMFSLIRVWINCRVNSREAGHLRRHRAHYDVAVMKLVVLFAHAERKKNWYYSGARLNMNMPSYQEWAPHVKDKTVSGPSYIQHGNPHPWGRRSLYWDVVHFPSWSRVPKCSGAPFINTLRPRQNDRHFADDTFKPIFLKKNIRISIKISLELVPKVPINNNSALVQIMAWRRPGDKLLSEPMMVCLLTHICVARPQWVKRSTSYH